MSLFLDHFMPKILGGAIVASGSIAVALSSGQAGILPEAPPAKDPLNWAFMVVIAAVIGGAGWVVKYTLTNLVKELKDLSEKTGELSVGVADLGKTSTGLGSEVRRLAQEIDGLATSCPLVNSNTDVERGA